MEEREKKLFQNSSRTLWASLLFRAFGIQQLANEWLSASFFPSIDATISKPLFIFACCCWNTTKSILTANWHTYSAHVLPGMYKMCIGTGTAEWAARIEKKDPPAKLQVIDTHSMRLIERKCCISRCEITCELHPKYDCHTTDYQIANMEKNVGFKHNVINVVSVTFL